MAAPPGRRDAEGGVAPGAGRAACLDATGGDYTWSLPPPRPVMRRLVLVVLLAAPPVLAQPALVSEASVDQEAYAAGETITVRYTVRNEGDERTALWGALGCSTPLLAFDTLRSPGEGLVCVTMADSLGIAARSSVTWVWRLDPDSLGVPERGGAQTVTVETNGRCGLDFGEAEPCPLAQTLTFTAPAAESGPLRLSYDPADADSVLALKRAYRATVTDSTARAGRTSERWVVRAVPLSETVAALDANDTVTDVRADRTLVPDDRFATPTGPAPPRPTALAVSAPAPNPAGGAASFTVRPARTERVTVEVVDLLGRRVAALHDGPLAGGVAHRFVVAAGVLPAGAYVVRVTGEQTRASRRVVVAR